MMATAGPAKTAVAVRRRRAGVAAWLMALLALASAPLGQVRSAAQASAQPVAASAAAAGGAFLAVLDVAAQFQADRVSCDPAAPGRSGSDPVLPVQSPPAFGGTGAGRAAAVAGFAAVPDDRHAFRARAPPAA